MPSLTTTRTAYEQDVEERILALLLLLRRDVEFGRADYSRFAGQLANELQVGLTPAFVAAANQLAVAELGGELREADAAANLYAAAAALTIARAMTEHTINGVAEAAVKQGSAAHLFARERAAVAAVTEVTRAISAGESFAARQVTLLTGRVARRRWRKADNDACPICTANHGRENLPYSPPAHPNCRCDEEWFFSVVPSGSPVPAGLAGLAGGRV